MAVRSWKFHATRLLVATLIVLAAGWLAGQAVATIVLALLLFVSWHLANLWRLYHWLHAADAEVPQGLGIWSDVFERIAALENENQRQRARYQATLTEFRRLTDAFPDATLAIDPHGNITWFNHAARELLGLQNPEDLGKPVTNLLRGPDFGNWLQVGDRVRSPFEMPSPRDQDVWLAVREITYQGDQRLIILRDNTEVHNVEQIRRDFVANISHELRTPLTVLQGYLELLQDSGSPDVSQPVARMLAQTAQMQMLLDDLLELSRLQNDELRSEEEVIDVAAMLMQLREQAEELSRGRHRLEFRIESESQLAGIASDLESAFGNLISNAIKYTPEEGSVTETWRDSEEGPELVVADSGIGIPRRDIPRITERFYRVGSDRARRTGGTGLGLSIVKHVLNAHQATLSIDSEVGEGSSFTCGFPSNRRRPPADTSD
jgi:two-component system phosphate regulon sensor histidine kinase PhoR